MTTISSTSTSTFYTTAAEQLASLQQQVSAVNNSISSGAQFTAASDNPEAAAQMRMMQLQDATATVDTASANKATSNLQLADSAMTQMVNDINQAKTLTTQAATGTLSDSQRATIGTQLSQIQKDLLSLANSRDSNGNALFGGGVSGDAYSLDASGNAVYGGTSTSQTLAIGGGQTVQTSLTGPEVLSMTDASGNATNVIDTIGALATALKAGGSAAQTAAQNGLTSLSNGLDAVTTAQTVIGSRESWITLNTQNLTAQSTARATAESQVGDTDVSKAAIKLQQLTTALQASQACFVKMSSLSLFSVIGN
ncbi:flagellin [Novosphingobium sp. Fuku2-ISO-50]|uniref:flagellin N-terminal helical domain-containing protein n=1 Tax=Novosphingobium sp. Fuku2-ISO-50 TaxID=1739114 RepID=UPI00076D128C|nr:flagellin [Novosphingobium sp. Fuku2-ISO-50]KUR74406.1 flagellar biosynthesis protein FlgL [Novosphingobium sp. Fuku2-ISO-50]